MPYTPASLRRSPPDGQVARTVLWRPDLPADEVAARFPNMVRPAFNIDQLTAGERFELIEQLWDSLRTKPGAFPMSAEERELIETRRAAHRRDPSAAVDWKTVRSELAADQEADDRADARGPRRTG